MNMIVDLKPVIKEEKRVLDSGKQIIILRKDSFATYVMKVVNQRMIESFYGER